MQERLRDVPQVGAVEWIGLRPEREQPMTAVSEVIAVAGRGLMGDRAANGRSGGNRQVTLVQAEHLPVVASLLRRPLLEPATLRRNLMISGINLLSLLRLRFRLGAEVILVGTGACAPCAKLEAALGTGGFQAMRGHGGITARIEQGGRVRVGDRIEVIGDDG